MAIAANFKVILNDTVVSIGDAPAMASWLTNFDTTGRLDDESAILTLMVKGLTDAADDVAVIVNNVNVGSIPRYNDADPDLWQANTISVRGANLNDGGNTLLLDSVSNRSPSIGNINDNYDVRNVVIYFHVEV